MLAKMLKSEFFIIVCFCFSQKALSLTCYTSNGKFFSGDLHNVTYKLQDCEDYIYDVSNTTTSTNQELNCFTISADYLDFAFKGCIPKGKCEDMIDVFRKVIQNDKSVIGEVECRVCEKNACNSASEDRFYVTPSITPTEGTATSTPAANNGNCFTFCFNKCLAVLFLSIIIICTTIK